MHHRRTLRIAIAARTAITVAAIAAVAGCGSSALSTDQRGAASKEAGAVSGPAAGAPGVAQAPNATGGTASASTGGLATAITIGTAGSGIERSVFAVYTVPVNGFLRSFESVSSRAVSLGGYVVNSSTQPDSQGRVVQGSISLKVPAAALADFLNGMPSTFVASAIDFSSVDHTAAFVDLAARLGSARAHLAALNALLARATTLGDITSLVQQIAAVHTEIDTYQGQVNLLSASVALATATVQMSERGAVVAPPKPPSPVSSGLGSGWSNAVQVTGAVLEGVVSAMPLLVLGLVAWVGWLAAARTTAVRRRLKRSAG